MKAVMKSIWTGEPNEKQREQRDFGLRHMLYQNRPYASLPSMYVQGHSGAAMRNKSEDVKKLLPKGIRYTGSGSARLQHQQVLAAQQTSTWQ
jgi:hypothetical protein